ncbi:NAD(P)-dependent oxidoreductase [Alkalilacustris brevis]|uniref:NAD(P)-dependent oxidoreductase n=1 Tax=Alkalilacustris brevis TaxID=2026338 RepID=UPI000E0DACD8|nr:DUF1932 domain-containing protein [Alkalilacustris brevis]
MNIAFIGFGEAARAFTDSLLAGSSHRIAAFDIRQDDAMAEAMANRGVRQGSDPADAIREADWIFSAVTADQSLVAAKSVVPHLVQGQVFFDINSVSPGRKRETAALIDDRGGRYIDMAVMAPVHPKGHATPVLLAGGAAEALADDLAGLGFRLEVAGDAPGDATAIKMVRSVFVKGLEAITVEAMLAAQASGAFEKVLASLSKSYPGLGWPENVSYNFERTLRHGKRRAAEMRESAATLNALGLNGDLPAATARTQDAMGALPLDELPEGDLAEAVGKVLAERLKAG